MRLAAIRANRHRQVFKDGYWIAIGQAVTMLASLLGIKLLTTLLSPLVYGEVVLLFGLATLGLGLLGVPILQANLRFFHDAVRDARVNALRKLSLRYLGFGIAWIVPLLLVCGPLWLVMSGSTIPSWAFLLLGLFLVAEVLRLFEAGLQNAARRQRDYALRSAFDALAKPLLAAVSIFLVGPNTISVLLGYLIGSAGGSVVFLNQRVRGDDPPFPSDRDVWLARTRPAFLAYALPLVPLSALNWIMSQGDRYVLAGVAGASAAGVYAAAYGMGSQPFIAVNLLIHSTLRPVLYDAVSRGDAPKEQRTLRIWLGLVLCVSAAGFILVLLLAPTMTHLFLGPRFRGAMSLLPWIAAAYALQNVQQTFEVMMYAHAQTRRVVALQILAAVSALTLYAILIPRFGARGAAMGTLGAFLVTCSTSFFLADAPRRLRGAASAIMS